MASVPNSPWFCSLKPTKTPPSLTYTNPRNCTFKSLKVSSSSPNSSNSSDKSLEPEKADLDPVKLAFAKAKAYKKSTKSNPTPQINQIPVAESAEAVKKIDGSASEVAGGDNKEVSVALKVAMERAKEDEKNRGGLNSSKRAEGSEAISRLEGGGKRKNLGNAKRAKKEEELTVSSIDFAGLNFSDKKNSRGLPPGLVPVVDPFPDTDLSEVEIIVGDASKFQDATASKPMTIVEENSDLYKPKVSTWGVFPRPSNISKTYGGGKVISPGEELETAEDKAAKEARTRKLLAAYKKKIGLNIDPKLKSECEEVLKDGDSLMDQGKLKDALPFYESVMDKLPFQTELHGLAALQWSICQDSLTRFNEARVMYEKLQSHPNVDVSKKASEFMFGFEAMEMLKVRRSTRSPISTGYQNYFDAFVKARTTYSQEERDINEGALNQALPYIVFLVSPIFIILLIAVQKRI